MDQALSLWAVEISPGSTTSVTPTIGDLRITNAGLSDTRELGLTTVKASFKRSPDGSWPATEPSTTLCCFTTGKLELFVVNLLIPKGQLVNFQVFGDSSVSLFGTYMGIRESPDQTSRKAPQPSMSQGPSLPNVNVSSAPSLSPSLVGKERGDTSDRVHSEPLGTNDVYGGGSEIGSPDASGERGLTLVGPTPTAAIDIAETIAEDLSNFQTEQLDGAVNNHSGMDRVHRPLPPLDHMISEVEDEANSASGEDILEGFTAVVTDGKTVYELVD